MTASSDLLQFARGRRFATILADPPWQFQNKTGKVAPEHRRLSRYATMTLRQIEKLPVARLTARTAHLYLWVPNALLPEGLAVMKAWGFAYKQEPAAAPVSLGHWRVGPSLAPSLHCYAAQSM